MESATEPALVGFFEKCQKATSTRKALKEMGHIQPPTPVVTYNTSANNIVNRTAKKKIYRAIDKRLNWVRERIRQNHFHIFWEGGKKNLED